MSARRYLAGMLASVAIANTAALRAETLMDSFAARQVASGASALFTGDSSTATREIDEPEHGAFRDKSVWGAWTAPGSGYVTISTRDSSFNTVLAVYAGSTLGELLPVAQNNDEQSGFTSSSVRFPTKSGETYSFAVDGASNNSSGQGAATVHVTFTAAAQPGAEVGTDAFDLRRTLAAGNRAIGVSDNRIASIELDEKPNLGFRNKTVWWRWVAPSKGKVTIDTLASSFDTALTVYVGDTLAELSEVAINDNATNVRQSRATFRTRTGQAYQIMVEGYPNNSSGQGNVILNVAFTAKTGPGAVPGADAFANRGLFSGRSARGVANNTFFTQELDEPNHHSFRDHTAWWQWTAPATGNVKVLTEGSDFDTFVAIYRGNSIGSLRLIAENNDASNVRWSKAKFYARHGVTYQIMVDGYPNNSNGQGNIALTVDQEAQAISRERRAASYSGVINSRNGSGFIRVALTGNSSFTVAASVDGHRLRGIGRISENNPGLLVANDGPFQVTLDFDAATGHFAGSVSKDGELVGTVDDLD